MLRGTNSIGKNLMNIAIVGGGFTGLTAAYELGKRGHRVSVFEKEKTLGGLAYGFREPRWDWHLEGAYHHWFTNDRAVFHLISELGLKDKVIIKRPVTASYIPASVPKLSISKLSFDPRKAGNIFPLDTPLHLFTFPFLSAADKLRTTLLLAFCKLSPFWKPLESVTAKNFFIRLGGIRAWKVLWEPLMVGKFGEYADTVAASWLWARIKKRTPRLAYIEGGFHTVVAALEQAIRKQGGKIHTGKPLHALPKGFDRTLLTIPTPAALKISNCSPLARNSRAKLEHFKFQIEKIPHLHAQTLILETRNPILDSVYWLNITDRSFPFLAVVAHTNFMDKKHYAGRHLTYFGNYLPPGHPYLSLTKEQLLKKFMPYIKKISSVQSADQISNLKLFVGPYAQPIHELHYSKKIPEIATPGRGVYLANMDFIVPWDRGTNYAVELGQKAAREMLR